MNMAPINRRFTPTSKKNPCPICGNVTGHCKTKDGDRGDTLVYCHNHAANPGQAINGHEWLKQAEGWGVFAPIASGEKYLSANDRDAAFRKFIASRKLAPEDRADLKRRGLSDEEIAAWDVVSFGGKAPGYLCPCYNPDGLIVGAQWRLREAGDGSRYKWVSWIEGGSKFEGELPLTVQRPVGQAAAGIAVVEGIGPKSFILAQRSGMATIGAGSDSQFISSSRHWRNYLRALCAELNTNTLHFYPDSGAVQNASVLGKYRQWFEFVADLGYEVKVAWWGQVAKGADADELDDSTVIQLISVAEFEKIAAEHCVIKPIGLVAAVRELVESNKTNSEIIVEAHALAVAHQFKGNVEAVIRSEREASEKKEEVNGLKAKLDRELKNRNFTVPLEKLFPGVEGGKFCQWLRWQAAKLGVDPLAIVFTWFPAVASAARQDNRIWLGDNHFAKPIIWTGVIGGVGKGKTPSQDAAIAPLVALDNEEQQSYDERLAEYDKAMKRYRKSGKNPDSDPDDEPEEPKQARNYILSDITMESLALTQAAQPEYGVLIYYDELAGLFTGMGQYKGGKGNDRQKLLQTYGGKQLKVTRTNKTRVFCKTSSISVTGSIQPEILAKMDTTNDADGMWARFNFIIADSKNLRPAAPSKTRLPDYTDWLKGIYKRVSSFAAKTYEIADDGFELFKQYNELIVDRIMSASRPVFAGMYSKARSKVGSFALILHLMNAALEQTQPAEKVSIETIAAATDLMSLSLNQAHQIIERGEEESGGTEAVCAAIWRYVDRRPGKTSDWQSIARGVTALRPKPGAKKSEKINGKASVMEFLRLLQESGCGQFLPDGRFMVSNLEPTRASEADYGEAEEVPIPDFIPEPEPEIEPEPEPEQSEPEIEVIGIGDRVIVTQGEHQGATPVVTEITDDYYARLWRKSDHHLIPDLNVLAPLVYLIKYTELRASEWRRRSREI